jgi:hypothetical protein
MFGGKSHEELVTLTEREDMAVCLGKELAAFLLEEHVAADPAKAPAEVSTACCPKCGQPGKPAPQKAGERHGIFGSPPNCYNQCDAETRGGWVERTVRSTGGEPRHRSTVCGTTGRSKRMEKEFSDRAKSIQERILLLKDSL